MATLKAMTAVVKETNKNLSPLQKLRMKWHVRLGHLSFQHVRTLGIGGFLDKYMLGLTKWVKTDGCPKCATCQFGKQVRRPDGTTTTVKNPSSILSVCSKCAARNTPQRFRIFTRQPHGR